MFEPKERIVCIIDLTRNEQAFVVCEGSVVYDLSNFFSGEPKFIDFLLNKKINHVSFDFQKNCPIFSSLYNKNKEDDKMYYLNKYGELEDIVIDIIPSDVRIVNIFSSQGSATMVHLGLFLFKIIIKLLKLF